MKESFEKDERIAPGTPENIETARNSKVGARSEKPNTNISGDKLGEKRADVERAPGKGSSHSSYSTYNVNIGNNSVSFLDLKNANSTEEISSKSSRALSKQQKIGVTTIVCLSIVLLICSSFGMLALSHDINPSLFQTTENESKNELSEADKADPSKSVKPENEPISEATKSEEGHTSAPDTSSDDALANAPDTAIAPNDSQSAQSDSGNKAFPSDESEEISSDSSGKQSLPPPSSEKPSSGNSQNQEEKQQTLSITVSVSSSSAGGTVSGYATPTFEEGASAYDALCATGLSIVSDSGPYGIYVSSIGGLAQFQHGGGSGWVYTVNGISPSTSCNNYILENGDVVEWVYVTG